MKGMGDEGVKKTGRDKAPSLGFVGDVVDFESC